MNHSDFFDTIKTLRLSSVLPEIKLLTNIFVNKISQ